jgi:predicted nucleic acid-binding protein
MITKLHINDKWYYEVGEEVLDELNTVIEAGRFHRYTPKDPTDKEIEGLVWDIFGTWEAEGNWETDRLYVTAEFKGKKWALRSKPALIFPRMVDRCFAIDTNDQQLSNHMSDTLFKEIENEVSG